MFINQNSGFTLNDFDANELENAFLSIQNDSWPGETPDGSSWEYMNPPQNMLGGCDTIDRYTVFHPLDGPSTFEEQMVTSQLRPDAEPSCLSGKETFLSPWQLGVGNMDRTSVASHSYEVISSSSLGDMAQPPQLQDISQQFIMPSPRSLSSSTAGDEVFSSPIYQGEAMAMDAVNTVDASQHLVMNNSAGLQKGTFRCTQAGCGDLTFKYESQLKKHVDRHTRPFACDYCMETFGAKKDLNRHRDTKHQNEAEVFCAIPGCKRVEIGFSRRDNLLKHIHNVHEQKEETSKLRASVSLTKFVEKVPKTVKKRKRIDADFEGLSREELIDSLLEEQGKNKRLLQEMEQQRGKLEDELRVQRERYEKNEDRLW